MAFAEGDSFFQRFFHFFVIECVGGAIDQATAIRDGDPAPAMQQFGNVRGAIFMCCMLTLFPYGAAVREKLFRNFPLLGVPAVSDCVLADGMREGLKARQKLLHLNHVIGQRLSGRVYRGQAAAYHHCGQTHLHIGDGIEFGRAGELQGH